MTTPPTSNLDTIFEKAKMRTTLLSKSLRRIQLDDGSEDTEDPMPSRLDEIPALAEDQSETPFPARREKWMPSDLDIAAWRDHFPMGEFRQWQEATIEAILKGWASGKRFAVVEGPTGCHAKGTPILMFDGTIKNVEDIGVGDLVMGPDSKPRVILELHRGRQEMVRITPVKGDPFIVNLDHILSLQRTKTWCGCDIGDKKRRKDFKGENPYISISVRDWLAKSRTFKHTYKLYRTGVTFPKQDQILKIPPYILGVWLGNGTSTTTAITNVPNEVVDAWRAFAEENECKISVGSEEKTSPCYLISYKKGSKNPVRELFRDFNLLDNKHVPFPYLVSSRQERLELLAGLLDTDGHLSTGCFDISQKRKHISESIVFLARSLGFAAYLIETKNKSQNGTWGTYYRVSISGSLSDIPNRVIYKKADERQQKKSVNRTGFKAYLLPEDDYFGFTVDEDNLYVMGDFTVTHNSGKSCFAITLGRLFGNAFLCTPQKMLQNQYMRDFSDHLFELKGKATYPCLRLNHEEWVVDSGEAPKDKRKKKKKGPPRDPIRGLDYISLADWNELPEDHIWRQFNCGNAPCNTRSNGGILKKECKDNGVCEYIKRRDYALNLAKFSLLNFSNMLLFSLLMPDVYAQRPLLIMDECHTLESFLYDYATITVGVRQLRPLQEHMESLEDFERIRKPFECMDDMVTYIRDVLIPAYDRFKTAEAVTETEGIHVEDPIEEVTEDPRDEKRQLKKLIQKLKDFIEKDEPTDRSHVLVPYKGLEGKNDVVVGHKIKPFSVAHLSDQAFGSSDSRVLLMSATILDPVTFCQSVGIEKSDVFFIRVPSTFPAENRLIVGDTTVGSMAYKHKEMTLPKMLDRILELSEKHSMHKGIIHTGNYENMHKFKRWVADADYTLNGRMLFQAQGTFEEKERLIKIHTESSEPTILCGPGFLEGIDLKDDLARFNIIMKLPFLSLADPLIKRKAEEFPEWYSLQVALALIQAIGRPVRSPSDWAVTYILDLLWKFFYEKNQNRLFPKHIQDAVRWISKKNPLPHH